MKTSSIRKKITVSLAILAAAGLVAGFLNISAKQDAKALIRKAVDATNNRTPEILDQCYAAKFIYHSGNSTAGPEVTMKSLYERSLEAYPDFKATIEDIVAEKDKAAVRMIFEGTSAEFGKKIRVVHHWIAKIEKGKITEVWDTADTAGMFEQLGYKLTRPDR